MRCPRRIYLPKDLRRGSDSLPPYRRSSRSIFPPTSSKMRRTCDLSGKGNERKKEGRKGNGENVEAIRENRRRPRELNSGYPHDYEAKVTRPLLCPNITVFISIRPTESSARRTKRRSFGILPRSERELKHFVLQWEFTQLSSDSVSLVISPCLSSLSEMRNVFFTPFVFTLLRCDFSLWLHSIILCNIFSSFNRRWNLVEIF